MQYCPKCRTEYEDWAKECSDCKVRLVIDLPPEVKPEPVPTVNYVKIHTTPDPSEVAFLKSILDGNNIRYFIKNEGINQTLTPFYVDGSAWMDILVVEDKADEARELLKEFIKGKQNDEPPVPFEWRVLWKVYFWGYAAIFILPTMIHAVFSPIENNWEVFNILVNVLAYIGLFLYCHKKRKYNANFWKVFFFILIFWDFFAYYYVNNRANALTLIFEDFNELAFFVLNIPMYTAIYLYAFKFLANTSGNKKSK